MNMTNCTVSSFEEQHFFTVQNVVTEGAPQGADTF